MKFLFVPIVATILAISTTAHAQDSNIPALGEVVVTANRLNARYAQQDRPVVGIRRQADAVVLQISISSDSRDETTRKREIQAMLLAALSRAQAAGIEFVTGSFELSPVTKTNYAELPFLSAGRVDTSQVNVLLKTKLTGSVSNAEQLFASFIKSVPKTGRGAVDRTGAITLTIVNPDQYRDGIVKKVAEDARNRAAFFGPEYAVQVSGIDGQVYWSQVSASEVFLYIPYRYTIVPK
jgi:uncharacterized protein YggE